MQNESYKIQAEKIDQKIKSLQEEKKQLREKIKAEQARKNLASRIGQLILTKFEGKPFEYSQFEALISEKLVSDYDRKSFGLMPLPVDHPKYPKKRGRKTNKID